MFHEIERGDLLAVQQRVLADGAVLEERERISRSTPLMQAIGCKKPAIALGLLEHRRQHDVNTTERYGNTALHWATDRGHLQVVQALVAAGANPAPYNPLGDSPLIWASNSGRTDVMAFLVRQPSIKASIDHIGQDQETALSCASRNGHQPIMQLLLDAGADPTIPAANHSPLDQALSNNHHAVVALLRHVIDMADCARALYKARSLLNAGAASLACLRGRVEQGEALLQVEFTPEQQQQQQQDKLRATGAFAVGVSGGENDDGLCDELFKELVGYLLPAWADRGPDA